MMGTRAMALRYPWRHRSFLSWLRHGWLALSIGLATRARQLRGPHARGPGNDRGRCPSRYWLLLP